MIAFVFTYIEFSALYMSGKYPEHVRKMSRKYPENIRKMFGKYPDNVRKKIREKGTN